MLNTTAHLWNLRCCDLPVCYCSATTSTPQAATTATARTHTNTHTIPLAHLHGLARRQLQLQQLPVLAINALKVLVVLNLELLKINQVQHLVGAARRRHRRTKASAQMPSRLCTMNDMLVMMLLQV